MSKLTVAEYAELHSISVQAVYKKINRLHTIEEERNGRKQIFIVVGEEEEDKTAGEEVKPYSTVNSTPTASTSTPEEQDNSTVNSTPTASTSTQEVKPSSTAELNPAILEVLQAQLEEKDRQIERLQKAAEEKDRQIQEQFDRFTALLMRSQELEALTHKLLLGQGEAAEEPQEVANQAEIIPEEAPPKTEEQEPPKKTGFFSRLFKRKK